MTTSVTTSLHLRNVQKREVSGTGEWAER